MKLKVLLTFVIRLLVIPSQFNPQLQTKFKNLDIGEFEMNGVEVTYHDNSFIVRENRYELTLEFVHFLSNPNLKNESIEDDEDKKIKRFLRAIEYDTGKGDKRSSRYKPIKHLLDVRKNIQSASSSARYLGKGITKQGFYTSSKAHQRNCFHYRDQGTCFADPNNLKERLEKLKLETKTGHDGSHDEMLKTSDQLLSMNIINKEQLDIFLFSYGK